MAKFAELAKKSPSTFGASLGANKPCPKKIEKMRGVLKVYFALHGVNSPNSLESGQGENRIIQLVFLPA
jgi:hypothetical protein